MDRQIWVEEDASDLSIRGIRTNERARDGQDSFGAVAVIFVGLWPFADQAAGPGGQLLADLSRQIVQGREFDVVTKVDPIAFLRLEPTEVAQDIDAIRMVLG